MNKKYIMKLSGIKIVFPTEEFTLDFSATYEVSLSLKDEAKKVLQGLFELAFGREGVLRLIISEGYKRHVSMDEIDAVSSKMHEFIETLTNESEAEELEEEIYDSIRSHFEQSEFVDDFEDPSVGANLIKRLQWDNAPDISKEEFVETLHFSDQTPFGKMKEAVEIYLKIST